MLSFEKLNFRLSVFFTCKVATGLVVPIPTCSLLLIVIAVASALSSIPWEVKAPPTVKSDGIGFIAQEVESLIPELISEVYDDPVRPDTSEKTKMLNYSTMTSVLTKAIQEQQDIIDNLKARIEDLEAWQLKYL